MNEEKKTLADQLTDSMPVVGKTSRSGFDAAHMVLAAGSTIVIYSLVITKAVGYGLPLWLAAVVAWPAAFVWYRAIEGPFRKFVLVSWAYLIAKKDDAKSLTANIHRAGKSSIVMAVLLGIATLALSILINPDITQGITAEADSTKEIAQAESVTSSYGEDRAILVSQLDAARKRDAERVRAAKSQAVLWIAQAEGSKGAEMRRLLHKGNGWAAKELAGAIRKARTKGDDYIQKAIDEAEAPTLQGQLTNYVSTRSASRDTINQVTASLVASRQTQYMGAMNRRVTTLNLVVFAALIAMLWFGRLVVIACIETGEKIDEDPGEGVMEAVRTRLGKINASVGGWVGGNIDKRLKFVSAAPALTIQPNYSAPVKSAPVSAENSLSSGFQYIKSEPAPGKVSESQEEVSTIVSAPPPAGFAVPKKVNAGFWIDDAVKYRKRVYGWWTTAHNTKKGKDTREDNRKKAEDAFTWFESQGCTVTKKGPGKVSIKFPKS